MLDEADREAVDARGHRGVGGEDGAGADGRERLLEVEAGVGHELADALEPEEARVALVGVEDLGRRVPGQPAERADRAHAADADEDLLADAVLRVAAVEAVGDLAQVGVVLLDVGVEQQQRHAADRRHPHPRAQRPAAGHRDADQDLLARGVGEQVQRQALGVERRVLLLLPAVERERLAEVAGAVEQADRDQRHAEVARRLEVVAGEDAEPARVVRQDLADPELHREVADRRRQALRGAALVPARLAEVGAQILGALLHAADEPGVLGQLGQALGTDLAEHPDGVAAAGAPDRLVDAREQVLRGPVPRPAQVHRELLEGRESGRELGTDGEATQSLHVTGAYGSTRDAPCGPTFPGSIP